MISNFKMRLPLWKSLLIGIKWSLFKIGIPLPGKIFSKSGLITESKLISNVSLSIVEKIIGFVFRASLREISCSRIRSFPSL